MTGGMSAVPGRLEVQAIDIAREVVAEASNPVALFSIGKDSCVLLHPAREAFYPANPPFPFRQIDTSCQFRRSRLIDIYAVASMERQQGEGHF